MSRMRIALLGAGFLGDWHGDGFAVDLPEGGMTLAEGTGRKLPDQV